MDALRRELDRIDTEMRKLFEERLNTVKKVSEYKAKHNIPVLDKQREVAIIETGLSKLDNKEYTQSYKQFIELQLEVSKNLQRSLINTSNQHYTTLLKEVCGRDGIFLKSYKEEDNTLYFTVEIEDTVFNLIFDQPLISTNHELDTYEKLSSKDSMFPSLRQHCFFIIEDSLMKDVIRTDYNKNDFTHYVIATYDNIFNIIAKSFKTY